MTLGDPAWQHLRAVRRPDSESTDPERAGSLARASEERLRFALAAAPIVLWTTDPEGVFTLSEGQGLAVLGHDPGAAVGRHVAEVYADAPEVVANVRRALGGETFEATVTVGERVFKASYAPLRDAQSEQIGSLGVGYDVTDLVRAEHAARQAREQAEALLELSRVLETGAEPGEVARSALAALGRVLRDGWLVLWQREGDRFLPLALHGNLPPGAREHQLRGISASHYEEYGLGTGQGVFLTPETLPGTRGCAGCGARRCCPWRRGTPNRSWCWRPTDWAPSSGGCPSSASCWRRRPARSPPGSGGGATCAAWRRRPAPTR